MISKTSKSVSGTSFYGGCIIANANDISKVCGEPYKIYDEKVTYEWELEVDGIPFTIYDYREISSPNMTTTINYHIGTFTKSDTDKVMNILKENGFKVCKE